MTLEKQQEEMVWNLADQVTEIVDSGSRAEDGFDIHCKRLFRMLRAGKKLGLLPSGVRASYKEMKAFTKKIRTLTDIETEAQLRRTITEELKERGVPEGMCLAIEVGEASSRAPELEH